MQPHWAATPHAFVPTFSRDMGVQFQPPIGSLLGVHTSTAPRGAVLITILREASGHKNRQYRGTTCATPAHVGNAIWLGIMRPDGRAIYARNVGPRICRDKKNPHPKGVRASFGESDGLKAIQESVIHESLNLPPLWGDVDFLGCNDLAFLDLESVTFKWGNHTVSKHRVELRSS